MEQTSPEYVPLMCQNHFQLSIWDLGNNLQLQTPKSLATSTGTPASHSIPLFSDLYSSVIPCQPQNNTVDRKSEMPFPLQLNGPRLAQSFCIFIYIYTYIYGCILTTSDHNHGLVHYAPAHCCSCHTRAYFFLSVRVSLRKKWSQEKSTENPSDILRFPSLCHQRLLTRSPSLRAQLLVTGCFFFHSVPRKKIQKFWAGNMCLSQHGAVPCRFAIHTQL